MIYLTRRERFNAAHQLYNPNWSDEKNLKVYGKCSNPNWHGHNYELFVTIKGEINEKLGYVADLKLLSKIIKKKVVNELDHRNINLEVSFMKGKMATTENLAIAIWDVLSPHIKKIGAELHKVRITETENNSIEYFGKK